MNAVGYITFYWFVIGWSRRCWLPVSGSYIDFIYIAPILGVLLVRSCFCVCYISDCIGLLTYCVSKW